MTGNLDDIADSHGLWETHIQHLQDDRGITDLWPPQVQAFDEGATDDANFLMVSPPGTGKTLVAELISVNEWVSSGNPVVYLVPYVALAEEK
ncbi:ski2-type helicase, partial [Halorubrum sp. SS5]